MKAAILAECIHNVLQEGNLTWLMTNTVWVKTMWGFSLNFCILGVFLGSLATVLFCWRNYLGYESVSVLLLREHLWMAALGTEQNKAQSTQKQAALEKRQHSVIQPLACAPPTSTTLQHFRSLLPPMFMQFLSISRIRSRHRVIPFVFTQRYSLSKYTHTLSHIDASSQTHQRPWRYIHVWRSCSLNVSEIWQTAQFIS